MALQIIVKGKVIENPYGKRGMPRLLRNDGSWIGLGLWAQNYIGKTIVISLEEEEKELDPIVSARLKRVLAGA